MRKSETYRNEIKSYIVRTGMTMTEVVDYLSDEYGWSRSVPNLSGKLKRGSLRYGEAVEAVYRQVTAASATALDALDGEALLDLVGQAHGRVFRKGLTVQRVNTPVVM